MIIIAGAGIGGLALGCAMARARRPFRIVERAPELRPAGAGIALSENALRALAHVGVDKPVRGAGHELGVAALCDWRGRALVESRIRELVAGSTVAMARTALQQTLLAQLGGESRTGESGIEGGAAENPVELGVAVAGYDNVAGGIRVRLANGELREADLLVGADGLHSTVRRVMRGEEPLRYAGYTSWRAIVDDVDLDDPDRFTESWGPGRRFGIVPLGRRRVYWFAVADAPAGERDAADPRQDLRARFAGWHAPIDRILAATPRERILRTDIFDRPPVDRWTDGRAVLLGDAAHPMTPNLGQGGCQAIEDAVVLADTLDREPTIEAALHHYQARRLARANDFVVRSYRFGQLAHIRPAPLQWLRNQALRAMPVRMTTKAVARDMSFRL